MQNEGPASARSREVARYYDEKTARILEKYGPGPRVHYHTGISDGRYRKGAGMEELRDAMSAAQELVLSRIARGMRPSLPADRPASLLDVGCGLGGGSIYLAQELGAAVTAITVAAEHLKPAREFAERSGVSSRTEFMLADAHELAGEGLFDGSIAIESTCYLDRRAWLARMAGLLRPGAELHIFDWMRGGDEAAISLVDEHWKTSLGSPQEYRDAAAAAGLELASEACLNEETAGFWTLAQAWNLAAMRRPGLPSGELARLEGSAEALSALESAFREGGVLSIHMVLRRHISSGEA
jgi:SAM-dependent methyltransferase